MYYYKYEISYKENGALKWRGYSYRDEFERAVKRLLKNSKVTDMVTVDTTVPGVDRKEYKFQ